jgi:hypothetical protein
MAVLGARSGTSLRSMLEERRWLGGAGQMKDILTTGLGLFLFGDVKFDARNVTGVCIGLLGGIVYSLSSYYERQKPARDAVRPRAQASCMRAGAAHPGLGCAGWGSCWPATAGSPRPALTGSCMYAGLARVTGAAWRGR